MGLFYAYLQDEVNDYYHYLIAFISREAADEWWRMISIPPSPYVTNVRRNSPQFYTQNDERKNNVAFSYANTKLPGAKEFYRKMFLLPLNGNFPPTIRPADFTDHISDRWYFIRSKVDPWSHWYLRVNGECMICGDADCDNVHVSGEYRTGFCVRALNAASDSQELRDFVMIGRDEISITAREDHTLHIDDAGDLKATKGYQGEAGLLFSDLKNRLITRAEKQVNGEVWEYIESVERGAGEVWELVD